MLLKKANKNDMLKIYFLLIFLCISFFIEAQVLDPTIINSIGGNINIMSKINQVNHNWTIDWSVGESLTTQTWHLKNKIIFSTGFLQPSLMLDPNLIRPGAFDFKLIGGPNPVTSYLLLSCKQAGIDIISINITNSDGNKIQNIEGPYSGVDFSKRISFASANTGIYFIAIHYIVANKFKQVKIIKIIKI
jgi:hypothetical protein